MKKSEATPRFFSFLVQPRQVYPFSALGAHVFHFNHGLGNWASEDAVAVFCDEQIVFDADATEVLVGFQLIIVDELLELAFSLPHVDESGNEVDARFISDHEAWF